MNYKYKKSKYDYLKLKKNLYGGNICSNIEHALLNNTEDEQKQQKDNISNMPPFVIYFKIYGYS